MVDDNHGCRHILQKYLTHWGALPDLAVDSACALEILRSGPRSPFDLILLDQCMPGHDGLAFSRLLREDPVWNKIPRLLLLAGNALNEREAGIVQVLRKPVRPIQLYDAILAGLHQSGVVAAVSDIRGLVLPDCDGRRILLVEDHLINRKVKVLPIVQTKILLN